MSEKPIFALGALSTVGGITGYALSKSRPSLFGGVGVGLAMGLSGMRIMNSTTHKGRESGYALSALSCMALLAPMMKRAIQTRQPVPIAMSLLGAAGTAYYADAMLDREDIVVG